MVILNLYHFLLLCQLALISHALPQVQPGAARTPPFEFHHGALSDPSDQADRRLFSGTDEHHAPNLIFHPRSDSSSSITILRRPFGKENDEHHTIDDCHGVLPGWGFVASVCTETNKNPRRYRIICTKAGPGGPGGPGDAAYFRFIHGERPTEGICVDGSPGNVRRAHCERQEDTTSTTSKRRKIISNSNLVKKSDTAPQTLASLAENQRGRGQYNDSPSALKEETPRSRVISECTGAHASWAFLSSACHPTRKSTNYRACKVLCSRRYKLQRPMGDGERSSVNVLSGNCLPEEICIDGYGPSGKAYCVRQDHLVGMVQGRLNISVESKAREKLQANQETGADFQNLSLGPSMADGKKHVSLHKRDYHYKREYGTTVAQCPGQPRWHLVSSGCHPAHHRKFWVICSEPIPIWHIPHEIVREGECTEREICINATLAGSTNPMPGLEHHYYPVAKCVNLVAWALTPKASDIHALIQRSGPIGRLAGQQKPLSKRTASNTASGCLISTCAGERWNWPVVLSGCNKWDSRKYYTVCAEPFPIWHIPEQVRTEGQCEEGETCVDGHLIGSSIKGLERFEYSFAKCVPNSEGRGYASPSSDRSSDPRTPSPPFLNEPNPRLPTASSTSKDNVLDAKQPLLRPDSAAWTPQHGLTRRNTKWRMINACPEGYPVADWFFWKATCDPNSPRDYTIQCKQRIRGLGGVHVYGQTVFLQGQCSMDEVCFQKGDRYYAKCVSHEAFASIVTSATEDSEDIGKPLNTRQVSLAKSGNLTERGHITQQKNWRLINQCFGELAHWPVDYSACDSAKGLRSYYFRCIEPNATDGQAPSKLLGTGHCKENELCVEDEPKGVAHCVKFESFVRMGELYKKYHQKSKPTKTETMATAPAKAAQSQPSRSQLPSQGTPSPENQLLTSRIQPNPSTTSPHLPLEKRALSRLINECPGPHHAGWAALASDCIGNRGRDYRIWCRSPNMVQVDPTEGRCLEDELCVPDYSGPPPPAVAGAFGHAWHGQHGLARCVKHESFARLAEIATKRWKAHSGSQKRSLEGLIDGRRLLNQCPEDSRMTVWTLVCHPNEPRKYFITCRNPDLANFVHRTGQCSEDKICVFSSKGEVRSFPIHSSEYWHDGIVKCVKEEKFIAAVLASKRDEGATTSQHKKLLPRQTNWRPINECPGKPHLPITNSACDPNHPRRYWVTCEIHNISDIYGPDVIGVEQVEGECEKDEVCISGYTAPPPANPAHAFRYDWHGQYGIAKCVKHEGFARIAELANKFRKMEIEKTTETKKTETTKKTQAAKQRRGLEKRTNWRPINVCPGYPNWKVQTSDCDPKHPRRYWITCIRPFKHSPAFRGAHPASGICLPNEICVSGHDGPPPVSQAHQVLFNDHGIAHCVKHDGFARIAELSNKYNEKGTAMETATATVPAAAAEAAAERTNSEPKKGKRGPTKRANWRAINSCPEGSSFLSSVCTTGTTRRYSIACRGHLIMPQSTDYYTGECEEDEVCVSAGSHRINLFHNYVHSRCVKHEGFARLAGEYRKHNTETDATRIDPTQTPKAKPRQRKRDLIPRANWRRLDECPGAAHLKVKTSACNSGNPRLYFIRCEYPVPQGVRPPGTVQFFGECKDNEVCVSGYTAATPTSPYGNLRENHGIAHCVKLDGFNRIAQLVRKYEKKAESKAMGSKSPESKKQKRNVEKRNNWHRLNQCPEELVGWTFMTSVCDSKDPRKYWIICYGPHANGRYGPPIISRPGQCSKTEICVSGYTGVVPQTPIPAYQVRNFGIAKCASQQSFVRIAKMVTEHGGKTEKNHAKRDTTRTGNNHILQQAIVETGSIKVTMPTNQGVGQADSRPRSQNHAMSRPISVCPKRYRGWTVISSSCNPSRGGYKHFRMWCSRDPYAWGELQARVHGKCADGEVCVPGAGGTETIPDPGGRKQNLTNARWAACVSVEKVSRIAKLVHDSKAKVRGRSAPAASGTAHNGPETAETSK